MHFFSFTLKMEADVVSLRYLGNYSRMLSLGKKWLFHHIVLYLFLGDAGPFYILLVSWSCIWLILRKFLDRRNKFTVYSTEILSLAEHRKP